MSDCPHPPVRRVITGHNGEGKSVVIKDEIQQPIFWAAGSKNVSYNIHAAEKVPVSNDSELATGSFVDTIATRPGHYCPAGANLKVFELAPGTISKHHRTSSLDYLILAEGSIILELDDGKRVKGDVVCQRGTAHTWRNEGSEWVRMYGVMLGANPVSINGVELKESWDIEAEK